MNAICKKSYPYIESDKYGNTLQSMTFLQTFLTGKTYKIINKMFIEGENWYSIKNESDTVELFSETDFNDYFTTIVKIRKEKLQKINKLNYE